MPISYPNSSGVAVTTTTTVAKIVPPYFPATINTTFPFSVTGTSPVEVGTFFLPSDFLYNLSGSSYYLTVVAFVTGASDATGSLVLAKNLLDVPVDITYYTPAGPGGPIGPFYTGYKAYDPSQGNIDFTYTFGKNPGDSGYYPVLSAPIELSCSAANVTCSVLSIYFSYSGSV
jgi:hypothetical protein